MRCEGLHKILIVVSVVTSVLLCNAAAVQGQVKVQLASVSPQPSEPDEIRELGGLIRDLQIQVQELNSELATVRAGQEQTGKETQELRRELELATAKFEATSAGRNAESSTPSFQQPSVAAVVAQPEPSPVERVEKVEDDLQLIDAKVADQYQTKVESGSKYRLRVSGIVLLNLFDSRGTVDSLDIPQIAEPPNFLGSPGAFGGSIRQSQIRLQTFGPDVRGARTSADVQFDFAGGFPNIPNGVATGFMRLRTGTIRLDWAKTSIVAGQDRLFFAPLSPTSLATVAMPALSYAGNLWGWTPQVRIEHRMTLSENSSVSFEAGILDSLTGDLPDSNGYRSVSWGEQSGQPAYATRTSFTQRIFGQNLTVGVGGYYGRQNWGLGHTFDGWAGATDVTLPFGKRFDLTGAFYRGRGAGGFGGAIGQTVLFNGSFVSRATRFRGLDSEGGWAQLKFRPRPNLEFNGVFGLDNPFAGEMRAYNSNAIYPDSYTKNLSYFMNVIYQVRSDFLISTEYRRLRTSILDKGSNSADQATLSLGYIF